MVQTSQKDLLTIGDLVCTCFIVCFIVFFIGFSCFNRVNLISLTESEAFGTNCKKYESYQLRNIRSLCNKNPGHFLTLPPSTIQRIRTLGIQKRRKRGRRNVVVKENSAHSNGLHLVAPVISQHLHQNKWISSLKLATINARSIKNKDITIGQYLKGNSIDLALITETWIADTHQDKAWSLWLMSKYKQVETRSRLL